jgi:hypothetical protein
VESTVDEHTLLANDESFGNVSVCPGGVVHVNMPHVTLKFLPEDFVRFAELIGKARLSYEAPKRSGAKPRLQVVSTESLCEKPPEGSK